MEDAADLAEVGRTVVLLHVARAEKHQRLGHGVKEHVQHRAERAKLAAEAQRRDHDARVVDARIGEQPPKIPLHEHERRGYEDGRHAKQHQESARVIVAEAFRGQRVETHDAVKRAVDESGAEQRGGRHGRFRVGVGLPCMHRRETSLGAVADQHHHKPESHRGGLAFVRHFEEHRPVETVFRVVAEHRHRGEISQHRAEQGQRDPGAAKDDVFPRRFERAFLVVEAHQQHRRQRAGLNRHPEQP